jgi:hypothetical protein
VGLYEAAGRRLDGAKYGNTPHDADASPHMGQNCYGDQHEVSNQLALKRRVESCSRKPLFLFLGRPAEQTGSLKYRKFDWLNYKVCDKSK